MNNNTPTRPLSALRGIVLPSYLEAAIAAAPTVPYSCTPTEIEIVPDFDAIFVGGGEAAWSPFTAVSAALLYTGAEVAYDILSDNAGLWYATSEPYFFPDDIAWQVSTPVAVWLGDLSAADRDAWMWRLRAEIQMHAVRLTTGEFPRPYSTGSKMALHLIIQAAQGWLEDELEDEDEDEPGVQLLGMQNVPAEELADHLLTLSDVLFEDQFVLTLFWESSAGHDFAMGRRELHPVNWFEPLWSDNNPWDAPMS